jgi:hypothetical protein
MTSPVLEITRINYRAWLAFCAVLIFASAAAAQRKAVPAKAPDKPPAPLGLPFDTSVKSLPPGYKGHDIVSIMGALRKLQPELTQSEFETAVAFRERLEKLKHQPLVGSIDSLSTLAFVLPEKLSSRLLMYQPEKKCFVAGLDPWKMVLIDEAKGTGTHIGQNVFGTTVPVRDFEAVTVSLNFDEYDSLPRQGSTYGFSFDVDPVQAPRIKPEVRLLVIGKLRGMELRSRTETKEATLSSPVSVNTMAFSVFFTVKEIWAINFVTGEIYGRLDQAAVDRSRPQ